MHVEQLKIILDEEKVHKFTGQLKSCHNG